MRISATALAMAALALAAAPSVRAQDAPMCNMASLGSLSCMANRACECMYDRGGTMTGIPEGFRWNCSINRPQCDVDAATIVEYRGNTPSYPAAISLERSDRSVNVDQGNSQTQNNTNN